MIENVFDDDDKNLHVYIIMLATFNFILLKLYFAGENSICINFKTLFSLVLCSFLLYFSFPLPTSLFYHSLLRPHNQRHHDIAVYNAELHYCYVYVCYY